MSLSDPCRNPKLVIAAKAGANLREELDPGLRRDDEMWAHSGIARQAHMTLAHERIVSH